MIHAYMGILHFLNFASDAILNIESKNFHTPLILTYSSHSWHFQINKTVFSFSINVRKVSCKMANIMSILEDCILFSSPKSGQLAIH